MKAKSSGFTVVELLIVLVTLFGSAGWFMNIYKLFGMSMDLNMELILRIVGVFAVPVGSIMGYM